MHRSIRGERLPCVFKGGLRPPRGYGADTSGTAIATPANTSTDPAEAPGQGCVQGGEAGRRSLPGCRRSLQGGSHGEKRRVADQHRHDCRVGGRPPVPAPAGRRRAGSMSSMIKAPELSIVSTNGTTVPRASAVSSRGVEWRIPVVGRSRRDCIASRSRSHSSTASVGRTSKSTQEKWPALWLLRKRSPQRGQERPRGVCRHTPLGRASRMLIRCRIRL